MPLSPIQLFRSNENSLAQILQGGNQTVSHIMDQAIQLGRDISNKQLSQEKDLAAMNVQQRAFDQRRAEAAQQDFEDQRRFARSAFESDRRYGLRMSQEARAGVKDLFAMGDASTRTDLAAKEQQLAQDKFEYVKEQDQAELAAQAGAEKARQGEVSSLLSPPAEASVEAAPVAAPTQKSFKGERIGIGIGATEGMSTDDRMRANNQVNPAYRKPVEDILQPQQPTTATPSITREQAAGKLTAITRLLRDPKTTTAEAQRLGEEAARLQSLYPDTQAPKPPTRSEERAAKKDERAAQEDQINSLRNRNAQLVLDSTAFPKWGGTTAEDEAWDDPNKRPGLEALAAEDYATAEEFANVWKGKNSEKPPASVAKKRKEFWENVQRIKGSRTGAAPAGTPSPVRALGL